MGIWLIEVSSDVLNLSIMGLSIGSGRQPRAPACP
jgi:hypothetical protein